MRKRQKLLPGICKYLISSVNNNCFRNQLINLYVGTHLELQRMKDLRDAVIIILSFYGFVRAHELIQLLDSDVEQKMNEFTNEPMVEVTIRAKYMKVKKGTDFKFIITDGYCVEILGRYIAYPKTNTTQRFIRNPGLLFIFEFC